MKIPEPPEFTTEELKHAKETNNYRGIAFEWYKYVGQMVALISNVQKESPAFKQISNQQYHILVGLMNRCARLLLANLHLSHKGKFGETTSIVDRCIFESAIKIIWLCEQSSQEKFIRYLADGLKIELDLKQYILRNIANRNGKNQVIEKRMLESIEKHIKAAEITDEEIKQSAKLPNIESILNAIGHNRLMYIAGQRMGSHHVHGTWPSLVFHYLDTNDDGVNFTPRGNDAVTNTNQFFFGSLLLIKASMSYCNYVLDEEGAKVFLDILRYCEEEILKVFDMSGGDDFKEEELTMVITS